MQGSSWQLKTVTSATEATSCCRLSLAVGCEVRFVVSLSLLSCSAADYFNTADI